MAEEIIRSEECCYLSTPAHVRSFVGRFIWIYTDKGELRLTESRLRFRGKSRMPIDIDLDAIVDIWIGNYSRWAKPIRLDYIAVAFEDGDAERTLLFTPTQSWLTPVWETNKLVAKWARLLDDVREERMEQQR
jgi:hypothetical protein